MRQLVNLLAGLVRLAITPIKPGPAAIGDPVNGPYGQTGAMANQGNMVGVLAALSNNGAPAFGNWSQTLIPNSLAAATINANNLVGGLIRRFSPGANFTDSTDTATNIVNAIPGAIPNQTFPLIIANLGSGIMTLGAGTGVTIAGTATIASNATRLFLGQVLGSAQVTITSLFQWGNGSGYTGANGL